MNPLTNRTTELYSNLATPHCVVGLGGSTHLAHNRAKSGFFVRAIQILCVMTGLNGETFGSVGSKCLPANPIQSCHLLLGGFGDGLKNLHLESVIMQNTTQVASATSVSIPSVFLVNNQAKTTSLAVADFFGKRHDDVLKKIRILKADCNPDFYFRNFAEVIVEYQNGKGGTQQAPAFEITKDGFTLLVMGFTGKKALDFKIAYINRFNEMESALHPALALTNGQHYVVAKDGVVIYHLPLTEKTSKRYIAPVASCSRIENIKKSTYMPEHQAQEIRVRMDRLLGMFHPFSSQFSDALGVIRVLRGYNANTGTINNTYTALIAPIGQSVA